MEYLQRYRQWLESEDIDSVTKKELLELKDHPDLIKECFYGDLEFGTGGLRGIIGPGSNRVNKYTIGKATQGLANYIQRYGSEAAKKGVAIAYDSRHYSPEFAQRAALILNANGIRTFLFPELAATPLLSFAVRDLNTIAGIVITASHNPPKYNGYKVYWEDGSQVIPAMAEEIIAEIKQICDFSQVKTISEFEAKKAGLFNLIGPDVEDRFIEVIKKLSMIDETFIDTVRALRVIYTPLHGTGNRPVCRILAELGFEHVSVVPEQEKPDADFSTVKYPNPEEKEAFNLAITLAKKQQTDLIIGTDPDCDRIGVVEQTSKDEYSVFTGNQIGVLLTEYILSRLQEQCKLPKNGVIIKTIVSTDMVLDIAKKYGIKVVDVLTGFKFIGEKIKEYENTKQYSFILGFEESYGYLIGTHARDKDGVVAAALICEMVAYYKTKALTFSQQLEKLMKEYGYYMEELISITMEGVDGQEKIKQIMTNLRKAYPVVMDSVNVTVVEDYLAQERTDLLTGEKTPLNLPASDVLKFRLADKSDFTIRPSGTEPKVKIYLSAAGKSSAESKEILQKLRESVLKLVED